MVVEIDDSGWGDLIGGAIIVVRHVDTNNSYVKEIPLESFQGTAFKEKAYFPYILQGVREGLRILGISKDEPLYICTGYILSEVRRILVQEGYVVVPHKITGITQELAEMEYLKHLNRLGIGTLYQAKHLRSFDSLLAWVLQDIDKREHLVKTGWKAWPRLKRGEKVGNKQEKL
jgi:hypothetical protein